MLLLGKIMILQGVGHPISCLGVCYANDPKKGGYMTPAPALDLTTSLRGDSGAFGGLLGAVRGHIVELEGPRGPFSTGKSSCMCGVATVSLHLAVFIRFSGGFGEKKG